MLRRGKPVSRSQSAVAFVLSRSAAPSNEEAPIRFVYLAAKNWRKKKTRKKIRFETTRARRASIRHTISSIRRELPSGKFFCFSSVVSLCFPQCCIHISVSVHVGCNSYSSSVYPGPAQKEDVNVTWPIEKSRKRCRSRRYEPVLHGFARARRTSALQP